MTLRGGERGLGLTARGVEGGAGCRVRGVERAPREAERGPG